MSIGGSGQVVGSYPVAGSTVVVVVATTVVVVVIVVMVVAVWVVSSLPHAVAVARAMSGVMTQ
jgi:hypothetical protein